jgi:hypothetical protein
MSCPTSPDQESLLRAPAPGQLLAFPEAFATRFMLVVDTEEEFDWNAPFNRQKTAVTVSAGMARAQDYFARADIRPLYVTDWPVIDHPVAGQMLGEWVRAGTADVGAHCHPWVNPPHEEEVSGVNSFAGNLPPELERAKITVLRDRISEVTATAPLTFRAGRYGAGPHTGRILRDLGFRIDTSVRSRFDYSAQHGPDFSGFPVAPWRAGPGRALIELPLSTAWTGGLRRWGDRLQSVVERQGVGAGLLARGGLLQRIPLTPEGVSVAEAISAIDRLLADGLRLLMFSFHSPTLEPGHTPYVRNTKDLDAFYRWWGEVLDHLARRSVLPAAQADILAAIR